MEINQSVGLFYDQVYSWCRDLLNQNNSENPIFIGVSGPQGIGKSTLTDNLVCRFEREGKKAISISIDDFYLTREEQIKLATHYSCNPYMQMRGYPGTHDIELGSSILSQLKNLGLEGTRVKLPRYDKSAFQGKGGRKGEDEWTSVDGPLQLVLFEGWMLGFRPVPSESLRDQNLKDVNRLLPYYEVWYRILDAFIQLVPNNLDDIADWRIEAEERMKASGKTGMSLNEVRSYITLFRPAYETYLPGLTDFPLCPNNCLQLKIDKNRLPL